MPNLSKCLSKTLVYERSRVYKPFNHISAQLIPSSPNNHHIFPFPTSYVTSLTTYHNHILHSNNSIIDPKALLPSYSPSPKRHYKKIPCTVPSIFQLPSQPYFYLNLLDIPSPLLRPSQLIRNPSSDPSPIQTSQRPFILRPSLFSFSTVLTLLWRAIPRSC